MADREYNVYQAKLAEQAERYDEMVSAMRRVASLDVELSVEERNLLAVGYKNQVGIRRASWRAVTTIEQKEKRQGVDNRRLAVVQEYREHIERELQEICGDVLAVLESHLLPHASSQESHVFYCKMKGDYYRYLTEVAGGDARREAAEQSLHAYQAACAVAKDQLSPTNPIRLGLALNFSVFYYEVLGSPERACALAKTAFDTAVGDLGQLEGESYKDTTLIMQLLRDNLKLWAADIQGNGSL